MMGKKPGKKWRGKNVEVVRRAGVLDTIFLSCALLLVCGFGALY